MEALSISFPPLAKPSNRKVEPQQDVSEYESDRRVHVINAYLENDIYETVLSICKSRGTTISCIVGDALDRYLSNEEHPEMVIEENDGKPARIRRRRLVGLNKIGVGVDHDLYVLLRKCSQSKGITMSEVTRIATKDYVERNFPEYTRNGSCNSCECESQNVSDGGFTMYIDLG